MMEIIYLGSFIGLVYTALGPKGEDGYNSKSKLSQRPLSDFKFLFTQTTQNRSSP